MMRLPIIVRDKLYMPAVNNNEIMMNEIRRAFSHYNKKAAKQKNMGYYVPDEEMYINTYESVEHDRTVFDGAKSISLPRGGTKKLQRIFDKYDIEPYWIDQRVSAPLEIITPYHNSVELWDEQKVLVDAMFQAENCLIRSPTASGKTETALKLIEYILPVAGRVLVIVWEGSPNSGLMKQWIDRISKRFNIPVKDIGTIGGGRKKVKDITVGMHQTLKNCIDDYKNEFGAVICDEVQRFAAKTFQEVITKFPARFRIGISADETRKDGLEGLIYDMFGTVVEEIDKSVLINKGLVCPVTIRVVPTNFNYGVQAGEEFVPWRDLPAEIKDYDSLILAMHDNEDRESLVASFLLPCLESGYTSLVVSLRKRHVQKWHDYIMSQGYYSGRMIGGKKNEFEFEKTADALRQKEIQVGVGTIQKMSTAHDIPTLERGFVLSPLAGNRQLFNQMMGRLGRSSPGKKMAYLYYFWDQKLFPYHIRNLKKHFSLIEVYDHLRKEFV